MQSGILALLATTAISLITLCGPVYAQTTSVPHDITVRFQTPDVAHPNSGSQLQSIWSANGPAGWTIQYDLTTAWNTNKTFGSFKHLQSPAVDMGLFTIPAIDYGEWGGGGQVFTKAKDTGLRFKATATGGSVSVDYPVHVHLDAPRFIAPGASFTIHVTYEGDSAAKVSTLSPQAYASINLMLNAQLYLNGRVEIASHDLFNADIIDWCDRDDVDSPKYISSNSSSSNKGFHVDYELFNTNTLVSAAVSKATYSYPDEITPSVTASLNFPVINTLGQPGSSSNYQSGAGGTGSAGSGGASYEYTTGITIPATVTANSNATYARGQDDVIKVTADFTNILTNALEIPPLNYTFDMKAATISAGLLDLQANLGLGFLQEFGFVPRPKIRLLLADGVTQTDEYEIDPINGVDIPVQMPTLPPGADPNANVSVKVTPIISMPNDFISNTYLNFDGGLSFRPIYLESSGSGKIGSFSFDPLDLQVGVTIPYPIYKTTFQIPFDEKTGDAFYVTTQSPPLAGLGRIYPSLLYVNENEQSGGYGVGVSSDLIALFTDPTIISPPPINFAGIWFGTLDSATAPGANPNPLSATALNYSTLAYWDLIDNNFELKIYPIGQTQTAAEWQLFYKKSGKWADLTPGIHHVYTANIARTGDYAPPTGMTGQKGSSFGPRITGLPLGVAYPKPEVQTLGVRCAQDAPGANKEFLSPHGLIYQEMTHVSYSVPPNTRNVVGPIMAGSPGFTLLAIDHNAFNDPNAPNNPNLIAPWSLGSFSHIKFDGKLLAPDMAPVYSNYNTVNSTAFPFVTGQIPASMISQAGYHKVQVANPKVGGKGGDSDIFTLHVVNPVPAIADVTVIQKNPVQGSNTDIESHNLTVGYPDTRIKITGSGLLADTKVYWRDTSHPLVTQFSNSTLLFATLPAAFMTQPQLNHNLLVVNARSTTGNQPVDGGLASTDRLRLYAAAPQIASLEVNGTPVNALYLNSPKDVTVAICGEHFWPGVTARWGQGSLPLTFVDEQTLNATIPASRLSQLGSNPIIIRSQDYNGNVNNSAPYNMRVVYATPILASLGEQSAVSPPAMQAGAAPPTLTLTGGLFYSGTKVTIGGKDCVTTFVDVTHLNVIVPTDIASATGSYPVVVINPTSPLDTDGTPIGDGGSSSSLPFAVLKYAPQAQISLTTTLTRTDAQTVQAQITLKNSGMSDASGMIVQSAVLSTAGARGLPLNIGSLPAGQSKTVILTFAAPASAAGTIATLKLSGAMQTGGQSASFSTSTRIQVP